MLLSMIGQTISHYKILEKLGEGGMGVVYKAEDLKLERFVALKFLAPHLVQDEESRRRFQREAKAAAALDHPNICTIHEIDEAEGRVFLAMAYLDGSTVRQKVKQRPLKLDEALDIAIQAGEGLRAAHEKGIVHRDIKSANLMVNARGQVKIMDFGLAQLAEQSKLTKTATILGTPAYMSPEQAQRLPADRRTDIWSLGVVIYEMVTGRTPFEGERQQAVLYAIASEQPEPITALRVGIPTELDRIVGKALAKKADERYQHIDEMLVDLREMQKQTELGSRDTRRVQPASKPVQRRGWYIAAAAVVIAIILGISAWLGGFGPSDDAPAEALQAVPLTSYPGSEFSSSFSPDGNQVAFRRSGRFEVWKVSVGGGEPIQVTQDGGFWAFESTDEKFVYYTRDNQVGSSLWKVPVGGGEETQVLESVHTPNFSVTPQGIYFIQAPGTDEPGWSFLIRFFDFATGRATTIHSLPSGVRAAQGLTVSPDGRSILYTQVDQSQSDLMLVENFR